MVTLRLLRLDEVFVKEGDTLVQGDSIGVAGRGAGEPPRARTCM